jgi:hypothetical protein
VETEIILSDNLFKVDFAKMVGRFNKREVIDG